MTEEFNEKQTEEPVEEQKAAVRKGKWFGRGIYGSKDVPIRLLDGLIAGLVAAIVILTIVFAIDGGYIITFDTLGGSEVVSQKIRHGDYVKDPGVPVKAGYEFGGWHQEGSPENRWYFDINKVGADDMTLVAKWVPAKVTVKFDLAGGYLEGNDQLMDVSVTFGEAYGSLPVPSKDGAVFEGWLYSGGMITPESVVTVNGEHVLTAVWG